MQKIQDTILNKQSEYLKEDINYCPKCSNKLHKNGINKCSFNSVFTDHKVPVHRQLCGNCKWSSVLSINSLFGSHMRPDLIKLQCEEASKQSYIKAKLRFTNTLKTHKIFMLPSRNVKCCLNSPL